MKRRFKLLVVIGVVVVLALAGMGTALAADPGGTPTPGTINIIGKIVSITPADPAAAEHVIALQAGSGSLEVTTNASTQYKVPGVTAASLANFAVGDNVGVRATKVSDKLVAAVVSKIPSKGIIPRIKQHAITGTVTAISVANITVQTPKQGTVTVITNTDTKYKVPGVTDATLANVKVDDRIVAMGEKTDAGLVAKLVAVMPKPPMHITGEVTQVSGNTVTVTDKNSNTFTITLPPGVTGVEVGQRVNVTIGNGPPKLDLPRQPANKFFRGLPQGRPGRGPLAPNQPTGTRGGPFPPVITYN